MTSEVSNLAAEALGWTLLALRLMSYYVTLAFSYISTCLCGVTRGRMTTVFGDASALMYKKKIRSSEQVPSGVVEGVPEPDYTFWANSFGLGILFLAP